jgi:hypothetical protein
MQRVFTVPFEGIRSMSRSKPDLIYGFLTEINATSPTGSRVVAGSKWPDFQPRAGAGAAPTAPADDGLAMVRTSIAATRHSIPATKKAGR